MTAPTDGLTLLAANQPPQRRYLGGARIAEFRGLPAAGGGRTPEDWIASTTPLFGQHRLGLSELPDGRLLAAAIEADPLFWLGERHIARHGTDPRLLTKLLDTGQRLFVHAHPDDSFATRHGFANGKAEAWFMLTGGTVHLGLREPVSPAELLRLAREQDTERLLGLLNRVQVAAGDVVAVPPGVLHSIGADLLLLELQQPADLSILLEWQGFPIDGAADGNLGLGLQVAIEAVQTEASRNLDELVRPAGYGVSVLPPVMDEFVRLERWAVDGRQQLEPGFGVLVVTAGNLAAGGQQLPRGSVGVLAHGAGDLSITGTGELLVARPPR
ncbi:MAG TPA: class I mannose-6-phosphate isomerase [Jatrophihabitans sp.]|nr:class I mannose-6-phosphate isomerase [Jatrophihabitans sp.]